MGRVLFILVTGVLAGLAQERKPEGAWIADLGPVKVRPFGFLHLIETNRSATMSRSVSTELGKVPLDPTPGQNLTSFRHSRLMLDSALPLRGMTIRTYLESDFMNYRSGESPYRWRQYWAQVKAGRWEMLGGQAWSLLRPNRRGVASDTGVMNTDLVEPAYHVGLLGSRRRQIRLVRTLDHNLTAAVAWEGVGNTVAKLVRDGKRLHWEIQGMKGIHGRKGAGFAAVYSVTPRVRVVTQEFYSRRALAEALGVVPLETDGISTIQGVEAQITRDLEIGAYGGVVRASQSAGNRLVREWSVVVNRTVAQPIPGTRLMFSLEFSHLDRATWGGRTGQMNYLMARLRYSVN